jgi:hypothetical protein
MKQTITYNDFVDAFSNYGRMDNFSLDGLKVLFDWLVEMEQDQGVAGEMELDVIAICCEFSEATPDEIADNYSINISECSNLIGSDDVHITVLEYMREHTSVCGQTDRTIVYQDW